MSEAVAVPRSSRWQRWVRFVARRESGEVMALFRIAIGLILLYSLLSLLQADLIGAFWVDEAHGGVRHLEPGGVVGMLGGATPGAIQALVTLALVSAVGVIVGLYGRVCAFVGLQCFDALIALDPDFRGGYDSLLVNGLWLVVLAESTATLSVDARRRSGSWQPESMIFAWPRYVAIVQIVVVYTFTGIQKLSPTWLPFGDLSALYWVYQDSTFRRFDGAWAASAVPLLQIGTFVAWVFEVFYPVVLLVLHFRATAERGGRLRRWFNRFDLRWAFVGIGVVMHLGIFLTLNVGAFSFVTVAYYVCLWTPEEVRGAGRWIRARGPWGSRRSPPREP